MCGIIYAKSLDKKPINNRLWRRYLHQKERGKEGYGYLAINGTTDYHRKRTEAEIKTIIAKDQTLEILFHHRQPTSTANLPEAAHPILIKHKTLKHRFYVTHNGIIKNADKLKVKHERAGFRYTTVIDYQTIYKIGKRKYPSAVYTSFNDSEALAIDLTLLLSGRSKELESTGSIAFICLETDKQNKPLFLHYGHNYQSPLVIETRPELLAIKSQGSGELIAENTLFTYNYRTGKTTEQPLTIGELYRYPELYDRDDYYPYTKRPIGYQTKTDEQLTPNDEKLQLLEWEIDEADDEIKWYQDNHYKAEAEAKQAEQLELKQQYDRLETDLMLINQC